MKHFVTKEKEANIGLEREHPELEMLTAILLRTTIWLAGTEKHNTFTIRKNVYLSLRIGGPRAAYQC